MSGLFLGLSARPVYSKRPRCMRLVAAAAGACAAICSAAQRPASDRPSNVVAKARSLRAAHQPKEAETVLQPYLADHPSDIDALTLLAGLQVDGGDRAAAEKTLVVALSAGPNAVAPNLAMGELLLSEDHAPEAMDRFETVLTTAPANAGARRGELAAATKLALSAKKGGHPDVAFEVLQHARIRLPDDPKLLFELGVQATEVHRFPEASEALNAARKLDFHNPDILYALGQMELEQQHMAAAEDDLRAYLVARPQDASAHFGLGHVLAMEQRTAQARAEFERSIELQPVQTESYYQIGKIELDVQHDAQAEPLFRKTLERDPTHGGALAGMGVVAFRAKDFAGAEQYLAAAEKTAPEYGPAHYYRGLALSRLGRKDEADAELRTAAELGKAHLAVDQDNGAAAPTATPQP